MPRYYFHWECSDRSRKDRWSVDLPDLAAARRWAETETYNLASVRRLPDLMPGVVTITDERDAPLARVLTRDVLAPVRVEGSRYSSFAS